MYSTVQYKAKKRTLVPRNGICVAVILFKGGVFADTVAVAVILIEKKNPVTKCSRFGCFVIYLQKRQGVLCNISYVLC